jgi:hypothetical protein
MLSLKLIALKIPAVLASLVVAPARIFGSAVLDIRRVYVVLTVPIAISLRVRGAAVSV